MEEATKVSSEVPVVNDAPKDLNGVDVSVKVGEDKVVEKEEEDTTFDGGFIKVEREGIDTKYALLEKQKQVSIERSSSGSQREVHEPQEKTKDLEIGLEKATAELKRYESENALLKNELLTTKGRLEESEKNHKELEDVKKKLQEQFFEGEERRESQLKSLEDALKLHDAKHKELTQVKEDFDGVTVELQNSKQKVSSKEALIEELTQELEKKKVSESQLEAELFALEEKLKTSDEKFSKTDSLLPQALSKNSDLEQKLKSLKNLSEEYREKVIILESSLNQTSARNSELEEDLRISLQKGAEHEDHGKTSHSKLVKAEEKLKDLEAFQAKNSSLEAALSLAMEKEKELSATLNAVMKEKSALESIENDMMVKLKSAEERLEKQAKERDEALARSKELESLTEKSKDHEKKLDEASAHLLALKEELNQSYSENELLSDTNNRLKLKIQELEGYLHSEKEAATEKFNQRDIEANKLITKLKSHESLIEDHTRQVLEASGVAETNKKELEETLSKLKAYKATIEELEKENGDLAEVNLKLNQKLANHGSEATDIQSKFFGLEAENEQTFKELNASKTAIEKLTSEGERLRSQISSLAEEKNQVNEIYQSTKNELVTLQEQLELEKLKSDAMGSEMKKLSAMAAEKSVLESNFEKVAKQLKEEVEKVAELTSKLQEHEQKASDRDLLKEQASQAVISEEKEAVSQKNSELEATLKKSQEEIEAKKAMILHLESLFKELEQKVQLADAKSKETEEVEVKSRDIIDLITQHKSKKKSDASSSGNITTIQRAETSHLMTLKIVLAVALVSVIIGIILGKKY